MTRYDWWGYVKGMIRRFPKMDESATGNEMKEYTAVKEAAEETSRMEDGGDRITLIDLVFWKQTHTLPGAAMKIPCSERTGRRWHTDFIKLVAQKYGLLN